MQQSGSNTKRAQIDKANLTMVIVVAVAAFVTMFSLVAVKSLWSRQSYQNTVIDKREAARDQLVRNKAEADKLNESYKQFVSSTENVIGGNPSGSGQRDGDNARIVLDALPSKYDFPALASSVEKLAKDQQLSITSLTGIDDEVTQSQTAATSAPQAVEMPFNLAVSGKYTDLNKLILAFEASIRPFKISKLVFTADSSNPGDLSLTIDGKSYYQPEKSLEFKKEVVK